jgi:hypothetical protein
MVLRANNRFSGIGGHLATYASRRACTRSASTTSSGQGRRPGRRPGLLPGPRRARASTPGRSSRAA